ncbi:hypothetical protein BP6252_00053 [Coleophoma cylindrospora]|uniref:Uncharacterized protein n=1 Tax=Coleophoma cylindrospora TaxID=1849047 RepID=A0A3D8SPB4_9HELO|nr:hypothetical protein BP6252_00053 [Coleophoma cylindrospora]
MSTVSTAPATAAPPATGFFGRFFGGGAAAAAPAPAKAPENVVAPTPPEPAPKQASTSPSPGLQNAKEVPVKVEEKVTVTEPSASPPQPSQPPKAAEAIAKTEPAPATASTGVFGRFFGGGAAAAPAKAPENVVTPKQPDPAPKQASTSPSPELQNAGEVPVKVEEKVTVTEPSASPPQPSQPPKVAEAIAKTEPAPATASTGVFGRFFGGGGAAAAAPAKAPENVVTPKQPEPAPKQASTSPSPELQNAGEIPVKVEEKVTVSATPVIEPSASPPQPSQPPKVAEAIEKTEPAPATASTGVFGRFFGGGAKATPASDDTTKAASASMADDKSAPPPNSLQARLAARTPISSTTTDVTQAATSESKPAAVASAPAAGTSLRDRMNARQPISTASSSRADALRSRLNARTPISAASPASAGTPRARERLTPAVAAVSASSALRDRLNARVPISRLRAQEPTPEPVSEPAPEPAPETTPEATPEAAKPVPETTPEPASEPALEPASISETVPESAPSEPSKQSQLTLDTSLKAAGPNGKSDAPTPSATAAPNGGLFSKLVGAKTSNPSSPLGTPTSATSPQSSPGRQTSGRRLVAETHNMTAIVKQRVVVNNVQSSLAARLAARRPIGSSQPTRAPESRIVQPEPTKQPPAISKGPVTQPTNSDLPPADETATPVAASTGLFSGFFGGQQATPEEKPAAPVEEAKEIPRGGEPSAATVALRNRMNARVARSATSVTPTTRAGTAAATVATSGSTTLTAADRMRERMNARVPVSSPQEILPPVVNNVSSAPSDDTPPTAPATTAGGGGLFSRFFTAAPKPDAIDEQDSSPAANENPVPSQPATQPAPPKDADTLAMEEIARLNAEIMAAADEDKREQEEMARLDEGAASGPGLLDVSFLNPLPLSLAKSKDRSETKAAPVVDADELARQEIARLNAEMMAEIMAAEQSEPKPEPPAKVDVAPVAQIQPRPLFSRFGGRGKSDEEKAQEETVRLNAEMVAKAQSESQSANTLASAVLTEAKSENEETARVLGMTENVGDKDASAEDLEVIRAREELAQLNAEIMAEALDFSDEEPEPEPEPEPKPQKVEVEQKPESTRRLWGRSTRFSRPQPQPKAEVVVEARPEPKKKYDISYFENLARERAIEEIARMKSETGVEVSTKPGAETELSAEDLEVLRAREEIAQLKAEMMAEVSDDETASLESDRKGASASDSDASTPERRSSSTRSSFRTRRANDSITIRTSVASSRGPRDSSGVPLKPLWLAEGIPEEQKMSSRVSILNKQLEALMRDLQAI